LAEKLNNLQQNSKLNSPTLTCLLKQNALTNSKENNPSTPKNLLSAQTLKKTSVHYHKQTIWKIPSSKISETINHADKRTAKKPAHHLFTWTAKFE
jgi:hypothetical protein